MADPDPPVRDLYKYISYAMRLNTAVTVLAMYIASANYGTRLRFMIFNRFLYVHNPHVDYSNSTILKEIHGIAS